MTTVPDVRPGLPRAVEVPLALAGLVVAIPVIVLAAAAVATTSGFPVFFRQLRVGRKGDLFTLVKLRTMRISCGGPEVTARGDSRVTRVGRWLRRSKVDELPELWNVLRGDMSFVGPRPEVPSYVNLEDPAWRHVLLVRPGLTDPVTIRLRDEESVIAAAGGDREHFYRETLQPQKLAGYRSYLRRRSWRSDLVVMWDTLLAILRPRGTNLSERPPNP